MKNIVIFLLTVLVIILAYGFAKMSAEVNKLNAEIARMESKLEVQDMCLYVKAKQAERKFNEQGKD